MSGAEAFAVISTIANIVALANFSRDVVSQIKEYGKNAHEVPKAFRDIQTVLPLISTTLIRTGDQIKSGILDDDTCKVLRPVLEGCENKLKQLNVLLKDVMAQEGASKLKRGLMSIKSMRKDKEVKEIAQALDRFVGHLVHYHASEGVSSKDIESLRLAMSSMSVKEPETPAPKTQFLVPVQWSDNFAGREKVMAYLESRLCLVDQHSRVALVGLGGMGKTRIALQYAKKFRKSSQISVFWVYAGTVERFKNAYREIARSLKIPGYQSPDSDILNLVKDWLESDGSGRWLLILDNADDAEIMYGSGSLRLADCLPRSDQGSILLTTRFQKVGANFTQDFLSLQSMTLVESELLLRARLGDESPEKDHDLYQELVKELERTPLALVQAASFMSQNCVSLDSYLQMYRQSDVSKIRLLSEDFEDDVRDSQAKNPIATTWIISFEYIKMHIPQAAELLSLISIMDAQAIPEFLLPQGEDAISFEKALGTLEAFSFISTRKQSHGSLQHCRLFDLHRLVRLAIRNWLRLDGTLAQWTAQTLKIVRSRCSQRDGNTFEISSLVLPHAIELLASDLIRCKSSSSQHFEGNSYEPSLDDLWSLSTTVSGRTRAAVRLLENVDTLSNLMIDAAQLLYYVTMRFRDVGNYVEARSFAAKDLTIITSVYGQSHKRTLLSMDVLASILQSLGDYEHAEQLRRQYVTICEAGYGTHHVLTLEGLLHLRDFLEKRQEQEAKEIGEVALRRCKESLFLHDGNEYLKLLSLLAEVQLDNGDFEEAEKCQVLALHGYQAVNDHINIIAALSSLSRIYERQDRWDLAGDTQRIELDIRIRYLGRNHPSTMSAVWHLTRILLNDKKEEEAKRQAALALELMSQIYGPSSETHAHYCREFDSLFAQSSAQEQLAPSEGQIDDTQLAS